MKQLTAILILLFSSAVYADDPHHEHYDGNDTLVTLNKEGDPEGVALAIAASQCQFDFGTYRLQGCISAGQYEETKAINFAAAKRFEDNRALFTGSVGFENGKAGIGAALIWRF